MILETAVTIAGLSLASLATPEQAPEEIKLAQAQPFVMTQGAAVAPVGQYMTTAKGCTYMRTQAPGYPPRWILVVNPQRLGMPKPPRGCRGMM